MQGWPKNYMKLINQDRCNLPRRWKIQSRKEEINSFSTAKLWTFLKRDCLLWNCASSSIGRCSTTWKRYDALTHVRSAYLYEHTILSREGAGSASYSMNGDQEGTQKSKVKVTFAGIRAGTGQRKGTKTGGVSPQERGSQCTSFFGSWPEVRHHLIPVLFLLIFRQSLLSIR